MLPYPPGVGLDQAGGGHVKVVPRLGAVGQPGVGEGPDEGAVHALGVEDAERLGQLTRLVPLVPDVPAALQPGRGVAVLTLEFR